MATTQLQWKAYFSMVVLEQNDPTINLGSSWDHQSCAWYATVLNFKQRCCPKHLAKKKYNEYVKRERANPRYSRNIESFESFVKGSVSYCHCCGEESCAYYCNYCLGDMCSSCGEIGSGSNPCSICRRMDNQ